MLYFDNQETKIAKESVGETISPRFVHCAVTTVAYLKLDDFVEALICAEVTAVALFVSRISILIEKIVLLLANCLWSAILTAFD